MQAYSCVTLNVKTDRRKIGWDIVQKKVQKNRRMKDRVKTIHCWLFIPIITPDLQLLDSLAEHALQM